MDQLLSDSCRPAFFAILTCINLHFYSCKIRIDRFAIFLMKAPKDISRRLCSCEVSNSSKRLPSPCQTCLRLLLWSTAAFCKFLCLLACMRQHYNLFWLCQSFRLIRFLLDTIRNHCSCSANSRQFCDTFLVKESGSGGL